MIAAIVTGLLVAAGAGVAGWLFGRRTAESRVTGLERRLALIEDAAGRGAFAAKEMSLVKTETGWLLGDP